MSHQSKSRYEANVAPMEIDKLQSHFCFPIGLSKRRKRKKVLTRYPVISRRRVKRKRSMRIEEDLIRPLRSGQSVGALRPPFLVQTLNK
jgi:hypothetical protein